MVYINNYELGVILDDYLINKKIRTKNPFNSRKFYEFTLDELKAIDSLTITGISSLKDIDKLPNLEKLSILSKKNVRLPLDVDLKYSNDINHIDNFNVIEKLNKLKYLSICNDFFIEKLDVKKLTNLEQLILMDNKCLTNIYNIENLKKLNNVVIVGNNIKKINDWNKYILNTSKTKVNYLDSILMLDMFKNINKINRFLNSSINFSESIGVFNIAFIDKKNTLLMYKNALELYNKLDKSNKYNYIRNLYYYTVKNITYDHENLKKRSDIYNKLMYTKGGVDFKYAKYLTSINSSAGALIKKKCVCEGYVQLIKFMLALFNIESDVIYCSDHNYSNQYDHAAIKISYKNKWYYFDPEWEQRYNKDYFFKTQIDFSKTHKLNARERYVYSKSKKG